MNLVLIETSGNQAFIFATNKLRENVGASELTARVGTQFILEAIQAVGGPDLRANSVSQVRQHLRDLSHNQSIDDSNPVEVILATSGKALLLVRGKEIGRRIIQHVTLQALKEAPGLEVRGVVGQDFNFDLADLHLQIKEIHRQSEIVRSRLPSPPVRFQRLPIIAECATSGLPAAGYNRNEIEPRARSAVTIAKRDAAQAGLNRVRQLIVENVRLPQSTTDIENLGCDWLAIVHADGNGLGQVFLNFDRIARTTNSFDYIDKLRRFSLALDECTEKAFRQALTVLHPKEEITPILPLVLGGDDLTVVCDGRQALQFTKKFIDSFEQVTYEDNDVKRILSDSVTSCAGVAIVKPHFPFFAGYQLAEELLQSAKKLAKKDPQKSSSAIDYHVLYDASGPNLERIRRELTADDGKTSLVCRPYITTLDQGPPHRRWSDLVRCIAAVHALNDDKRRRLPSSMLHELREGLFLGRDAADARMQLILERYLGEGLDQLLGDRTSSSSSLFWQETVIEGGREKTINLTALLDAIDTAEFWEALP